METMVINPSISEDLIKMLGRNNLLSRLAECSGNVVCNHVFEYMKKPDADPETVEMLKKAYAEKMRLYSIFGDETIKGKVNVVTGYKYTSLHAGLSVAELEEMKENIEFALMDEYDVPYIHAIDGYVIDSIINDIKALYRVNGDRNYKKYAYVLESSKILFRDKSSSAKGTIFKAVQNKQTELRIILGGINFLLDKKRRNIPPESWRVF